MGGSQDAQNFFDIQPNSEQKVSPQDSYISSQTLIVDPSNRRKIDILRPVFKIKSKELDLEVGFNVLNTEIRESMKKFTALNHSHCRAPQRVKYLKLISNFHKQEIRMFKFKLAKMSRGLEQMLKMFTQNLYGRPAGIIEIHLPKDVDEKKMILFAKIMASDVHKDVDFLSKRCSELYYDLVEWESKL